LSPSTLRHQTSFDGHESFNNAHRQNYTDDRESFLERQPQSWDRDQENERDQYPPTFARSDHHPDRDHMFETFPNPSRDMSASRSSKPVRIRRPGLQSIQIHPDEYSIRPDASAEHWSNGDHGEERGRDESGSRIQSHHQRPTPSRRGGSLLDRLSLYNGASTSGSSPSLRDRVQIVPSKRDREEMVHDVGDIDLDDGGQDDSILKKSKRRVKARRGRRSLQ